MTTLQISINQKKTTPTDLYKKICRGYLFVYCGAILHDMSRPNGDFSAKNIALCANGFFVGTV